MIDQSKSNHGTLVWIGPTDAPAYSDAFRFCSERFPQVAVRRNLKHCLDFPADHVSDILVVRSDRGYPDDVQRLINSYPTTTRFWALAESECEGEFRTGTPWSGFVHFYWHQWNQVIPGWFQSTADGPGIQDSILIITADDQQTEPLADWFASRGHVVSTAWYSSRAELVAPTRNLAIRSNFDLVIWDDSVASPCSRREWKERLQYLSKASTKPARHVWLCGFPRIEQWLSAKAAGINTLVSKPSHLKVWTFILMQRDSESSKLDFQTARMRRATHA